MVKHLGHHLRARNQQRDFYWQHLREQYSDRLVYYDLRGKSRRKDTNNICIIQDGLDQSKVALPRSSVMFGKDFSTMQKPKLHISLTIVHGFFLLFTLSNPDTQKNSDASIETIAHALSLLQSTHGMQLGQAHIHIQADNTCREVKNNHFLRFCACQVSSGNVGALSVRFLRTGHSHEDVDQVFGRLARHLAKLRIAQTQEDFARSIRGFAADMYRPHEAARYTVCMNDMRDWKLSHYQSNDFCFEIPSKRTGDNPF